MTVLYLTPVAGIGAAIADFLLKQSHNLVLIARTEQPLEELRKRYPEKVQVLAGDLGDLSLAQRAVQSAIDVFGKLDGLILNHGMMDPVTKIETSDIDGWRKLFDVNFFSAVAFVSIETPDIMPFPHRDRSKQLFQYCVRAMAVLSSSPQAFQREHTRHGAHTALQRLRSITLRDK